MSLPSRTFRSTKSPLKRPSHKQNKSITGQKATFALIRTFHVEQRKQEKRQRQRSEQKKLREKSKQNSNVVEMRKQRAGKSSTPGQAMELLPERVSADRVQPMPAAPVPQPSESAIVTPLVAKQPQLVPTTENSQIVASDPVTEERHGLIIPKQKTLKRLW